MLTLVLGQGDLGKIHRRRRCAVIALAREFFGHFDADIFLCFLSRAADMRRENALIDTSKGRLELVVI